MSLYLFDAAGTKELLLRDPEITCLYPVLIKPRPLPFTMATNIDWNCPKEGRFLLTDVYRGLETVERGSVKALRIVAVPAKTHPTMNHPNMGITRDDPGKCVLGTVPVQPDGSAHFRIPSGVIVFFQALDAQGMAIQTMRSTTHVQPGQTLSCIGCHEARNQAPPNKLPIAATRPPAKIRLGPQGTWPLRFDRLVQPVLNQHCIHCHNPEAKDELAATFDLTPAKAYDSLVSYGAPSLRDHVLRRYRQGRSTENACAASCSPLLAELTKKEQHHNVQLTDRDLECLIIWMDTYAQRVGAFSKDQEHRLEELKKRYQNLLTAHREQ